MIIIINNMKNLFLLSIFLFYTALEILIFLLILFFIEYLYRIFILILLFIIMIIFSNSFY